MVQREAVGCDSDRSAIGGLVLRNGETTDGLAAEVGARDLRVPQDELVGLDHYVRTRRISLGELLDPGADEDVALERVLRERGFEDRRPLHVEADRATSSEAQLAHAQRAVDHEQGRSRQLNVSARSVRLEAGARERQGVSCLELDRLSRTAHRAFGIDACIREAQRATRDQDSAARAKLGIRDLYVPERLERVEPDQDGLRRFPKHDDPGRGKAGELDPAVRRPEPDIFLASADLKIAPDHGKRLARPDLELASQDPDRSGCLAREAERDGVAQHAEGLGWGHAQDAVGPAVQSWIRVEHGAVRETHVVCRAGMERALHVQARSGSEHDAGRVQQVEVGNPGGQGSIDGGGFAARYPAQHVAEARRKLCSRFLPRTSPIGSVMVVWRSVKAAGPLPRLPSRVMWGAPCWAALRPAGPGERSMRPSTAAATRRLRDLGRTRELEGLMGGPS
jgi:hypothetical protein